MDKQRIQRYILFLLNESHKCRYVPAVLPALRVWFVSFCLIFLLFILPVMGLAQPDTLVLDDNLEMEKVVISGRRSPVVYSRLSRIVDSKAEAELRAMPVSSVQGALQHISGVDVRQRGAMGMQGDLSIRGSSFDQNMVLLNGIDVTDPQTGHFSLNLPVDISNVREIEVLKGPGSRVFGPNAFGGAVNVITAPLGSSYVDVNFTGGSHWYRKGTANANFSFSGTRHYLSVSGSGAQGFAENTDFTTYNLFYHGSIDIRENELEVQAGHQDKAYGAQSFYTPEYPHQFERVRSSLISVSMNREGEVDLEPAVYWRRHQDRFELFREDQNWYQRESGYFIREADDTAKYQQGIYQPWNYYSGHNYHLTDVYGSKLNASFQTIAGETSLGFDFRSENIWSNVLGQPMNDTLQAVHGPHGFYDHKYSRTIMDYYLEHNLYVGGLSVSAGILGSWSNEFDLGWKWYPGIDLSYRLSDAFTVYGSWNKSLRLPTFTDLFYSGPSNLGNPDLKPERVKSYEGGVKLNAYAVGGHLAYFYYDGDNIIAWTRESETDRQWQTKNLTEVINSGVEVSLSADISRLLGMQGPLKRVGLNYTYLDQDKITEGFESKYSLNYLNHDLGMYVYGTWKDWSARISSSYTDRAGKYLKYDFGKEEYIGEVAYRPAWVFDGKISYNWKQWNFGLEVTNIFNNKHYDIGNVRTPGRWIKIHVGKNIDLDF
jgi:iron complex outermembrane receptor protein